MVGITVVPSPSPLPHSSPLLPHLPLPAPHLSDGRFLLTHPACAQEATCVGGTRQELGAGKSEEATCVGLSVDEQSLTFLLP